MNDLAYMEWEHDFIMGCEEDEEVNHIQEWWIPAQKPHTPETTKWYCMGCGRITPLERNPSWDGKYKGLRSEVPEWFVRCAVCHAQPYQLSEYGCHDCGWSDPDENTMVKGTKPRFVTWASIEFGGNPQEWEETHRCPMCKNIFTFVNANF